MVRYPHKLYVTIAGEYTKDEDGNIIQSEASEGNAIECRAEYNSGGKFITTDGAAYAYHFAVYMQLSVENIMEGSTIRIVDSENNLIFQGQVKSQSRGQFIYRLWV